MNFPMLIQENNLIKFEPVLTDNTTIIRSLAKNIRKCLPNEQFCLNKMLPNSTLFDTLKTSSLMLFPNNQCKHTVLNLFHEGSFDGCTL